MSVAAYERDCARRVGRRHAIAFGRARHALAAILRSLDLPEGCGVVIPALTCKAVPLAVLSAQRRPVFADLEPGTLGLDPEAVREAAPRASVVILQHTFGCRQNAPRVAALARRLGIAVIEDAAQCLPLRRGGHDPSGLGAAAVFSADLQKPLGAGCGGMAVTDDEELAGRIRRWRERSPKAGPVVRGERVLRRLAHRTLLTPRTYWWLYGAARRLSPAYREADLPQDLRAVMDRTAHGIGSLEARWGRAALARIEEQARHRERRVAAYRTALGRLPGLRVPLLPGPAPLAAFPVLIEGKDRLVDRFRGARMEIVDWPGASAIFPLATEADARKYGYEPGRCPVAESTARRLVGLPTHRGITDRHARSIIELVRRHLEEVQDDHARSGR